MLSQRIRELRVAQGYSQVTLAKRLGGGRPIQAGGVQLGK